MRAVAVLLSLLLASGVARSEAQFSALALVADPAVPGSFVGSGKRIEVRFFNENAELPEPDAFPEPPVVLRDIATGGSCSITEGGVWARTPLLLSADERLLLTYQGSGSSAQWVMYDTGTCVAHSISIRVPPFKD